VSSSSPDSEIRLVLADVDGTLVTQEKVLTDRARKAVLALHAKNILFAITSGRPPKGMKMLIEPLELKTPVAGFNGGVYTRPDLTVLSSRFVPADVAARVVEMIRQHGLTPWLYTATDWYVPDPKGPHVDREAWTVKFPPLVLADFSPKLNEAVKIVGVSDDLAAVAACEADCQKAFPGAVSAQRSQPYYLDVTNVEANKGSVVEFLAQNLKLEPRQIATLGDMPNDVPMFRKSGLSIAMGQSSKEVQGAAYFVTDTNGNEGFARAIEKHFLGT
jgi:Cof subfamily protein (haloacid dehalogenase superfamily)